MRNIICNHVKKFTCNSDEDTGCWCQNLPIKKLTKSYLIAYAKNVSLKWKTKINLITL